MAHDKNRFSRDIRFIIYAGVAALLFMAAMHGLQPRLEGPMPTRAEAEAFALKLAPLPGAEVKKLLADSKTHKPTLLVIYASWCKYCRGWLPELLALRQEGKLDHIHLVFISVDSSPLDLAAYILQSGYAGAFTPYIVRSGQKQAFAEALSELGSGFTGSIPYNAVTDANGRVQEEFLGDMGKSKLLRMIENQLKK